jgi:hypothetical protein
MMLAALAAALLTPQMRDGIDGARYVPRYSLQQRAAVAQTLMSLPVPPRLHLFATLTPNHPYAAGGAHLSFWKTSFVLGTRSGGEAGVNFWDIHNEGHINVGFRASKTTILDCRLIAAGPVTVKVYAGAANQPREQSEKSLENGHLLLVVPAAADISVELWPAPIDAKMGFLGCDLARPII